MNNRRFGLALIAGIGCVLLLVVLIMGAIGAFLFTTADILRPGADESEGERVEQQNIPVVSLTQEAIPALPAEEAGDLVAPPEFSRLALQTDYLTQFYDEVNPGVVSIQIFVDPALGGGAGAGSGFIIDEEGHIVTNHHVVAGADSVIVVFYDGFQMAAEVVGSDDDSDLAVLKVPELIEGAHPLAIGDSDEVDEGQFVVAIGNPFGLASSMTLGIVSAVGRIIPSLAVIDAGTAFSIPSAIQTDAAINPGNSGGPLLNLDGQVIGVNAQIRTGGAVAANAGVGFAIPANVVRLVAPVLIEQGSYQWPWLGVSGAPVGLLIAEANDLDTQDGAYIDQVVPGSPAAAAGLQGSTGRVNVAGAPVPVGGDVILEINGEPIDDFADLLTQIAFSQPGEAVELTVLRNGERLNVTVELGARDDFSEQ
jgi:2-alkenal reductase